MVLKVLKPFRDKETKIVYNPGDVAEFSDDRAKVIVSDRRKLAEPIEKKEPEPIEKPAKKTRKKSK